MSMQSFLFWKMWIYFKERDKSDKMAQSCNPSTHEVEAGGLSRGTEKPATQPEFQATQGNKTRHCLKQQQNRGTTE